jgi:cytidine deaminase
METSPLTDDDRELIDHAIACNERAFDPEFEDGAPVVAAAVLTTDGAVYEGVSLPTTVGPASVHGEPVAVGAAIADGHTHDEVETCVVVSYPLPEHENHPTRVIPPCGSCRELLADYNREMRVITPVDGENRVVQAIELLPGRPW